MNRKLIIIFLVCLLPFTIGFAQLHHFSVEAVGGGNISTQVAGVPLYIEVLAKDSLNITVTSFNGTVDIISTGNLFIGGGTTSNFVNGVLASHQVEFSNTGYFNITATNTAGVESGTSNTFNVNPGPASKIVVESAADGTGSVIPAQILSAGNTVNAYSITRDSFNNFIANISANNWSLVNSTGGVLASDLIASGDKKSAIFTGHLIGSAEIRATSSGLTSVHSGTITVVVGTATRLTFTQQPSNGIAGAIITPSPIINVKDAFNNNVKEAGHIVNISIPTGEGNLTGTLTKATDTTGSVIFDDLRINQSGSKTLIANSSGLNADTSVQFTLSTYTIAATAGANGIITPSGTVNVNYGGNQTFTITPNTGYHVDSVYVDGGYVGAVTNYPFTNVTSNHTINAKFTPNILLITVQAIPNNGQSITVDGIRYTTPQTFSWIAATAHTISTDSVQNGVTGTQYVWTSWNDVGSRTHTVSPLVNTTFIANFKTQYYLTMIANPGGTVTPSSSWYDSGYVVIIRAYPDSKYSFNGWSGSVGGYSGSVNPYSLMMNGSYTETASFTPLPINITVQTNPSGRTFSYDGQVNNTTQTFSSAPGLNHTIDVVSYQTISDQLQYRWKNWSDGGAASHNIQPTTDTTFTAYFGTQFILNVVSAGNGYVTPTSAFQDSGKVDTLNAVPSTGYHFKEWRGTGSGSYSGTNNPALVFSHSPINDTAYFAIDTLIITATSGTNGSISPSGSVKVTYSSNTTFTMNPNTGYHVDSLYVDGSYAGNNSIYTFTNVITSHTIRVTFAINQFIITASAGPHGVITPSGVVGFSYGANQTFTITPNTGYVIDSVIVDDVSQGAVPTYTFINIIANHTIRAVFAAGIQMIQIKTYPDSLQFIADGVAYISPHTFGWITGTPHTIAVVDTQSKITDTRYLWKSWSDGETKSRTFIPGNDSIILANFGSQYYLTMISDTNGTITPVSSWQDSGNIVSITAVPKIGYRFNGWVGHGIQSYTGANSSSSVTMRSPITQTATFGRFDAQVTIRSNPDSLLIAVDDTIYMAPHTFLWMTGSTHSIAAVDTQSRSTGARYLWNNWSDNGSKKHFTSVVYDSIITANFSTQYYLTMTANVGGSVTPSSGWYTQNQIVTITALPSSKYRFISWSGVGLGSGEYNGTNNPASVTMDSPISETANFVRKPIQIVVQAFPPGRSFMYDGVTYSTPQTQTVNPGDPHYLGIVSPQDGITEVQYVWENWSDGGSQNHTIFPDSNTTYTAMFATQYKLSMGFKPPGSGSVTPSNGWQDSGRTLSIKAVPNLGYSFSQWIGTGNGSYSGSNDSAVITMNSPITDTAQFVQYGISVTIGSNPPGRTIVIDGDSYTTTQHFVWIQGSNHTISTVATQAGDTLVRYLFGNWSDGDSITHVVVPLRDTTFTANFTTQYFLTMAAESGGTVSPSSAWHNAGDSITISATPNAIYHFGGWNGVGVGSYTGSNNPAQVIMNSPIKEVASFAIIPIRVNLNTNPEGRLFIVDSTAYTTSQTFVWELGSQHTIGTSTPQSGASGVQYLWKNWSDGKSIVHQITPVTDSIFTLNFSTQYYLTMSSDTNGYVAPSSGWQDSGSVVQITGLPKSGYKFNSWTGSGIGSYSGSNNPGNVLMGSPIAENATFMRFVAKVVIGTNPDSLRIVVDGVIYTSPKVFHWITGTTHTIFTADNQSGQAGIQYIWKNWSDSGAIVHNVVPLGDSVFTADFTTQYYLTMFANPGGSVTPSSGWYNAGKIVEITAVPDNKYEFNYWAGVGNGSVNGNTNPTQVNMKGPISEIANFSRIPVQIIIQTNPAGRLFVYDSIFYNTPQTRLVVPGYPHHLDVVSPQPVDGSNQYVWSNWSDSGAQYHLILPDSDTVYVANFKLQHALIVNASPINTGTTIPAGRNFFNSGDTITVSAIAASGYVFSSWSGDYSGTSNPCRIVLDKAKTLIANFALGIQVVVASIPQGRIVIVDDSTYITPKNFSWLRGANHLINTSSVQSDATGIRYLWNSWSDHGSISHSISPVNDSTFTANYITQFYLTMNTDSGGIISPSSNWHGIEDTVVITAKANDGFTFAGWVGTGTGSYTGTDDTALVFIGSPITQRAIFGKILPPPTLSGISDDSTGVGTATQLSWIPYPSATSYQLQVSTDSSFTDSAKIFTDVLLDRSVTSYNLTLLANLTSYYWRVRAQVGYDITTYSTFRTFTTLNATLSITSPYIGWAVGYKYKLEWKSVNLSGGVNIKLSTDGGASFNTIKNNISQPESTFEWTIPEGQNVISNDCKLRLESFLNNDIFVETDIFSISSGTLPVNTQLSVSIPYPQMPAASTEYKLFSCPGILNGVKFGDFLSGTQKADWRAFTENGQPENYFVELSSPSNLSTGMGYWLIKKGNLDLPNYIMTMPPLDSSGATFGISLHPDWNIIANPFDKNVPWQAVLKANGLPLTTPIYSYAGHFTNDTLLERFKGYYFLNEANLSSLKIPYPFGFVVNRKAETQIDWQLKVVFESDINTDPENYFGIAPTAKQGKDELDNYKPPLFLDQGFLYFVRPEWNTKLNKFNSDMRPVLGEGQIWDFEVSNPRQSMGTIHVCGINQIPKEDQVLLINLYNDSPINVREHQDYSFEMVSSKMKFKIIVGTKEFAEKAILSLKPNSYELCQNFPNPFNSSTSITIRLPKESIIRLEVYNILGQWIKSIVDGNYSAGVHTFTWDGTDDKTRSVASGVYFYRFLSNGQMMDTKKMIISK